MKINKNQIIFFSIALLFLTAFIFISKYIKADKTPPHWDYAMHLNYTLTYYENIKEFNLGKIFSTYVFYPPLNYLILALFFLIFGYSKLILLIFNFSLLTLLSWVIYRFTIKLFDSSIALISLCLLLLLIIIYHPAWILIWELMLDFPLMVIIFICYCVFHLSFKNKDFSFNKSVQLGLLCGSALLIKWSAIIYLVAPIAFYLFLAFRDGKIKKTWVFFLSFVFLAGGWYFSHLKPLLGDLKMYSITQGFIDQDPQGLKSIGFYLKNFYFTTEPLIFIIPLSLLLALSEIIKKKEFFKKNWETFFDWSFLGFPFLFFTLLTPNKDPRYLYPFYILSIMICFWRIPKYFDLKKIWWAFPLILIIMIVVFPHSLPQAKNDSLINELTRILLKDGPRDVAYFFESDSSSFNYANVMLLHHQLRLKGKNYPDNFYLNQMNTLDEQVIHGCHHTYLPEAIFIFKEDKFITPDYKWQASFEEDCPLEFRSQYKIKEEIDLYGDKLIYLSKKAD